MATATAPSSLTRRIASALHDRRYTQALDLARQAVKQDPGPETQALYRKCLLQAGEYQVGRASFRDAHQVLSEAEQLATDDPAWWERVAELRADLGDHTRARQLMERVPDPKVRARILGKTVDRGMREGNGGKALLPADLHAGFDAVRKAFGEYEAGKDDQARETLNAIGLGSPFLEWKLLLRGLISWSTNDDARALENWSRLTPDRLPAKIAAPFRMTIDRGYAATLGTDQLNAASRQIELIGAAGGTSDMLRRLRKQLATEETFLDALHTARQLVPELKRTAPQVLPRMANIFYWAIVNGGEAEDLATFGRLFGAPPDDPNFHRLQALVLEQLHRLDGAHSFWHKYEQWIASTPTRWPGATGERARALVLERMGRLARDWLEEEPEDPFEELFGGFGGLFGPRRRKPPGLPHPLKPSAEECFKKAADLAPDWVGPTTELLREYENAPVKAKAVLEDALRRFPNDVKLLEEAAKIYETHDEPGKAAECLRKALSNNPLDRGLRDRVAALSLNDARRLAVAGKADEARAVLKEAAALGAGPQSPPVLALGTAIEMYAGNTEAVEAGRQALFATPDGRVAAAYRLFVELSRLKFKKNFVTPFQNAFTEALAGDMTGGEMAALLDAVEQYRKEPVAYRGLKSHDKKILDRLTKVSKGMAEDDLVRIGLAAHRLEMWKVLKAIGENGDHNFHHNPYFAFFMAEAIVARQRSDYISYRSGALYARVKREIDKGPDERYRKLRELLDERVRKNPEVERWFNVGAGMWDW